MFVGGLDCNPLHTFVLNKQDQQSKQMVTLSDAEDIYFLIIGYTLISCCFFDMIIQIIWNYYGISMIYITTHNWH